MTSTQTPPALAAHLRSMSAPQLQRHLAESRKALRQAWPHRHTLRGRMVVEANVRMLRTCRGL